MLILFLHIYLYKCSLHTCLLSSDFACKICKDKLCRQIYPSFLLWLLGSDFYALERSPLCNHTVKWFICENIFFTVNRIIVQFGSVQSLSCVWLFATAWTAARQASLSITNSWSSLTLTSIKLVMPSSHLILCHPLLLLPPIPPSIRVFSNESTLRMRWPKYWSFSFKHHSFQRNPRADLL